MKRCFAPKSSISCTTWRRSALSESVQLSFSQRLKCTRDDLFGRAITTLAKLLLDQLLTAGIEANVHMTQYTLGKPHSRSPRIDRGSWL